MESILYISSKVNDAFSLRILLIILIEMFELIFL